ncbi:MAG TPA: hypothetical protein HA362_05275 [Nanoarchaeota archaeon]|nr:hypothetical protein [Nanoarchaeota archaeon]
MASFWLDKFKGQATGGIFYRAFDLVQFIGKVEEQRGKVVAIKFDGSYNMELITEDKKENTA